MARDVVVHFSQKAGLTARTILVLVRDYIGKSGTVRSPRKQASASAKTKMVVVGLGAPLSFARRRVGVATTAVRAANRELEAEGRERRIEVWIHHTPTGSVTDVYVSTRFADDLTNDVASGLAGRIAQAFGGSVE